MIALLRREIYDETAASGACVTAAEIMRDLGYRKGHNDRARSLIAWLSQGDVNAGLAELREAPTREGEVG